MRATARCWSSSQPPPAPELTRCGLPFPRSFSRAPARPKTLHGANRSGSDRLNRQRSTSGDQPFDNIECHVGPKIFPHDPCPSSQGPRRAAVAKNEKAPSVTGGAQKSLCAMARTRKLFGSPAQGGLDKCRAPHGGRLIEIEHGDDPKLLRAVRKSRALRKRNARNRAMHFRQSISTHPALTSAERHCLCAISQLARCWVTFPPLSCSAKAGHPVFQRRLSRAWPSLEYWIARSSRAMTARNAGSGFWPAASPGMREKTTSPPRATRRR